VQAAGGGQLTRQHAVWGPQVRHEHTDTQPHTQPRTATHRQAHIELITATATERLTVPDSTRQRLPASDWPETAASGHQAIWWYEALTVRCCPDPGQSTAQHSMAHRGVHSAAPCLHPGLRNAAVVEGQYFHLQGFNHL